MTTTRERAITSLAQLNSVVATYVTKDPDDQALLQRASMFIRAIIDGATDEQLDAAHEALGPSFPVRCRIVRVGWSWACRSAGCGASGPRSGAVLIENDGPLPIPADDVGLPAADHPYERGERCIFDEQRRKMKEAPP